MAKKLQRKIQAPKVARASATDDGGGRRLFEGRGVSIPALSEFTTQLATLIEAGLPIVRSLKILEGQMKPGRFKRILKQVTEEVESGAPLSEALAKHPGVFDRLYTNMIRAGEAGGIQDQILDRLSTFMEKAQDLKAKVKGALAYPVVVGIVAVVVIFLVMTFVVPKFEDIYRQMLHAKLPWGTQTLIGISHFAQDYWWLWIVVALLVILHKTLRNKAPGYRRAFDRFLLRIPILGQVRKKSTVAMFSRTFGTLIQSGVPHLEALEIIKASTNNMVVADAIEAIHSSIREGEGIAQPMGQSLIFDDMIVNMVDVGEQTGELDKMLLRISDRYEVEVDRTVTIAVKAVEILLILTLTVVVGFIVFALIQPMATLMEGLGRGR
jgi:type IV pilus assembly protein PilC